MLDDSYLNMEVTLPRGDKVPAFSKAAKQLCDENCILIGTANDNPILDTRVYEVKNFDGHKS